jgi:hypothetical protein
MPIQMSFELVFNPEPILVANAFFASADKAKSLANPLREAVDIYSTEIDLNFYMQGRPDKWAPLSARTVRARLSQKLSGPSSSSDVSGETKMQELRRMSHETAVAQLSSMISELQILIDTDTLHGAAVDPASWAITQGGQNAEAQLEVPAYGAFHITGTGFMPSRDWSYISDQALEEIDSIFSDWVMEPMME